MSSELRQEIRFEPGYDHRAEDAQKPRSERRGCHGLNIRFLLHGDEGVVQFLIYTSWLPSWSVPGQWGNRVSVAPSEVMHAPMAADLGQHWLRPIYDGNLTYGPCEQLGGRTCFYDGSGLNADPVFAALLTGGTNAVWSLLEDHYRYCSEQSEATAKALTTPTPSDGEGSK